MTAAIYNITIEQGASWPDRFIDDAPWLTLTDDDGVIIPLTGYTAVMAFAADNDSAPFKTLTTENGGISIDGAGGSIDPDISGADTLAMTVYRGVYGLKLISPAGGSIRVLKGSFSVDRGF